MNAKQKEKMNSLGQLIVTSSTIVAFIVGVGWKVYAEDKVDLQIDIKLIPIEEAVKDNSDAIEDNSEAIEKVDYQGKQILFLMKQVAGAKAVRKMEEETAIFKPRAN